jgi:Hint domain
MATFNIPAGNTQTVSVLSGANTINGGSTAAYGEGGGTLIVTNNMGGTNDTVNGGILSVSGPGTSSNGAIVTLNNASFDMSTGSSWNNTTINFGTGASGVIAPPGTSSTFNGAHFIGMNNGDYISTGSNSSITNISYASGTLNFTQGGVNYAVNVTLGPGNTPHFVEGTVNGHMVLVEGAVVCFAAGTLIRTPHGEVAIEDLNVGDLVVVSSGERRPVKWTGHRTFDLLDGPKTHPARPIRIAADAFGPGQPSENLYLSSPHSVCVDLCGETLIPVGNLVNGATIARCDTDAITYWHVELDSHDILFANGLRAESYLAMGNRGMFERESLSAFAEGRHKTHADFCRPVLTEGPVLAFVHQRLLARAGELGWTPTRDDPDLRLVADGRVVRPLADKGAAAFLFPASAKDVRLMSKTFCPALALGLGDHRDLGVMLAALSLSGSHGGEPRCIALDDKRLSEGVHGVENHGGALRRWTKGEAILDPQFWEGLSGQVALLVTYDHTTVRGWTAPAPESAVAEPKPKLYAVQ